MAYMEKVEHREQERMRSGQPHVLVEAQGHLFRLKVPGRPMPGDGAVRGTVTTFSLRSRKRMLESLARLDMENAGFVCFVTLTYPDGPDGAPAVEQTNRDLQVFFKRLRRHAPECSGIWRREWEARKSGAFAGTVFPHFHMLFFGLPFLPHEELNRTWREVVGVEGYLRTEIKGIASWKQALHYVSKYMAKVKRGPGPAAPARTCGGDAEPPASRSLVNVPYLAGATGMGRSWGIFNRKSLPVAERKTLLLPTERFEWVDCMKGLAMTEWPDVDRVYPGCGFTLFTENPYRWVDLAEEQCTWRVEDYDDKGNHCPVPF